MRKQFSFADDVTFLNHGSFGVSPNVIVEKRTSILKHIESEPDNFMRREAVIVLTETVKNFAPFIGANPKDIVFVVNASTGSNCVLNSWKFNKGDVIITPETVYEAVRKNLLNVCKETGAVLVEIPLQFPVKSDDDIVGVVREYINKHNPKFAIFDHISSASAVIFPVEKLTKLCHEYQIPIMIDGAHAVGQVELNLEKLDCDFYTSNCHKWLYTPRGCAFLWVKGKYQNLVHPPIVSHNWQLSMQEEFFQQGTRDFSSFLSINSSLRFYKSIGGYEKIVSYNHQLVCWAASELAKAWNTELLCPPEMLGNMATIRLPEKFQQVVEWKVCQKIWDTIWHQYKIEVPLNIIQNKFYLRISCNIYNKKEDYLKLISVLAEIEKDFTVPAK